MKPSLRLLMFLCPVLLLSCANESPEQDKLVALSDTTSVTGLTGDAIKLVKTGSLSFKVRDIEQSAKAVSGLAQQFGGMVFDQSLSYEQTGRNELRISEDSLMVITVSMPQAGITVRVPSENLEAFMYSVTDLGYFTGSSRMHIDDQSLRYLENVLKQKSRTETLSRPNTRKEKSFTDVQKVEARDAAIEQQIAGSVINADAKYSTVDLSLFQNPLVRKEVIANYVISDYQLPFSQRLGNAISDGWQYFLALMLVLAHLWMFILAGLAALLTYRYLQQKRKAAGFDVTLK